MPLLTARIPLLHTALAPALQASLLVLPQAGFSHTSRAWFLFGPGSCSALVLVRPWCGRPTCGAVSDVNGGHRRRSFIVNHFGSDEIKPRSPIIVEVIRLRPGLAARLLAGSTRLPTADLVMFGMRSTLSTDNL